MKTLTSKSKEEMLELRTKSIGGSDAKTIFCDVSHAGKDYEKTIIDIWKEKTGEIVPIQIEEFENPRIDMGNILEDYIVRRFQKEYPQFELINTKDETFYHPEVSYIHANLDSLLMDKDGNKYVFEAKTADEFLKDQWTEESIPVNYYLQVQHYLMVTGLDVAYIAVLFRNSGDYQSHIIERDDELILQMLSKYGIFWNCVTSKTSPVIPIENMTTKMVKTKYPNSTEKTIDLSDSLINHVTAYVQINAKVKELEAEQEKHKIIIQENMKDAEKAKLGSFEISWKTSMGIDEEKLKACEPNVFSSYSKMKLDVPAFRKEMKALASQYLKAGARKFTVKIK